MSSFCGGVTGPRPWSFSTPSLVAMYFMYLPAPAARM